MLTSKTLLLIFSIIYVSGISFLYFSKVRMNNTENKIYKILLITNIIGLILQLGCDVVSFKYDTIPNFISHIFYKLYLVYFLVFVNLMLMYLISIALKEKKEMAFKLTVFSMIVESLILCVSPYKMYRDVANRIFYTYGIAINLAFLLSMFVCAIMILLLMKNIKEIQKKKSLPIYLLIVSGLISALIQNEYPDIIIITCMESFICCLMYFTIENPDMKSLQEMELAKTKLEKAYRAKSDFLSSMSHEFKTPLNIINGLCEDNLQQKDLNNIMKNCNEILEASNNLIQMVDNVFSVNKLESNEIKIIENVYNLKEEIEKVTSLFINKIKTKNLNFNCIFDNNIPEKMLGDKEKIKEIVSNLLSNAIKYTNEGTITLSFKCEAINKNKLKLFINCQDSGVGIAKSDIDKIFNKFERLGNNDSNIEGAGLGLVITNALIELMGGKIEVDSQVNKGSIFKVELLQKTFNNEDIIDKEIETAYEEDFSATYVFDSKTKEEYVIKNGTRKNK